MSLGISVDGPTYYFRERPDGVRIEWDLAFVGEGSPGATLPFIIKDLTPRDWRVNPSASVLTTETGQPTGVAMVVLGVRNLESATDLYRRVYGWRAPQTTDDATFGARLAHFAGSPVVLAAPQTAGDWLSERLATFGHAPCAYLLRSDDLEASRGLYGLSEPVAWFDRRVAWVDPARLHGARLGFAG
jgi:hypothetical protein